MGINSNRIVRISMAFLALLFPILVLFVFFPLELYAKNAKELGYDIWLPTIFIYGGAFILIFVSTLTLFGIRDFVKKAYLLLGAFVLLADVFAPVQLSRLDGASFASPEPISITAVEVAILVALLAVGAVTTLGTLVRVFAILSIALIAGLATVAAGLPVPPAETENSPKSGLSINGRSDLPNIYHFHLDEMQSDFALAAIEEMNDRSIFRGFTFMRRNISNYPYTLSSVASYLTGTIFRSGSFPAWRAAFDQGLLKDLRTDGYTVDVVGLPEILQTNVADVFFTPEQITKYQYSIKHPQIVEFSGLLFAKLFPNFLTNEALGWGHSAGERISAVFERKAESYIPKTVEQGVHPFQAVVGMKYLIANEQRFAARGRYTLFQAILPHGPYVLDANCMVDPERAAVGIQAAYRSQASCAMKLVVEFLQELKRLDRYDDAIIVIQSDHGSGWAGFLNGLVGSEMSPPYHSGITAFGGTTAAFESRSMATLMIKPSQSDSDFAVSDGESQLIDVYPTIMDAIGHQPNRPHDGLSLLPCLTGSCESIRVRPQKFFVYPHDGGISPLLANTVVFTAGHAVFTQTETIPVP
ncbi:hypothetical protein FJ959_19715 [Mesorhizobium sp. B2-2-4]|uniref:sulfatase-like hydrolase/transferase n=1 Tax=unclassified Mesorhizobium TaxID=325217 RepID=UPI00112BCFB0|nr:MULTISPECIES: sulfatase-like hydrolase/transferase [unclassified Mesorhizobium]TPM54291.1 hypothetical protein FJ959_19715 [Mesorhizobium sp. B2-2-4]TPM64487.1 hypothetical protein FJ965_17830 [Mesorhizobium sp. B2-2-1]TPN69527.1 hypothetical protein FJ984_09945 [Mesorhizobium sp. B1-1-3]